MSSTIKGGFLEKFMIRLRTPNLKHKTNFFRLMAVSQKAGLGIRDSLLSIKQAEPSKGLRMIIGDLVDQITQGESLASAMENHDYFFGFSEIETIRASQITGNLPDVLQNIAEELDNFQNIKQNIKKAMTYPILLLMFSVVAVIVLLIYVIPNIVSMFPDPDKLPGITKFMLKFSAFLQDTRYALTIGVLSVVFGIKYSYIYILPFKIFVDSFSLKIPLISGLIRSFYMYRFCALLGQFYEAGVNPVISLKLMSIILTNFQYRKKILEMKDDLVAGFTFYDSMEGSLLFDTILIQIMKVGENTGTIGASMRKISIYYDSLLKTKITVLITMLEPILMVFVAIVVGGIVGSIFIPMADMLNVLGE